MKKVLFVVLVLLEIVIPKNMGANVYLILYNQKPMWDDWIFCKYRAFKEKLEIPVRGKCPSYLILNRDTGGWTF